MLRLLKWLFILAFLAALAVGGWFYFFQQMRLDPPATPAQAPFEFRVKQGASLRSVAKQLADAGVLPEPYSFWLLGRALDKTVIHAGTYRLDRSLTPRELLDKLYRGDVVTISTTFKEGITFAEMLRLLAANPSVKQTLTGLSPADVLKRVGVTEPHPEGWFFPDTYFFAAGSSDLDILKRAHTTMKQKLNAAWEQRAPNVPYKTPYEALIMASIIEKETGKAEERPLIASVFVNRLRIGMRLQTDPTVIYGMGAAFDGNIRKRDLTTDTPYNTYTRDGLPPTPIAMPGWGSLIAAVQPDTSDKLYFVGKGDGTHYFSKSLDEHNRAVAKYQLGR